MSTLPQVVCGVIPSYMLRRIAERTSDESHEHARSTLEHMRELSAGRGCTLMELRPVLHTTERGGKHRRVHDARHRQELPGTLVMDEGGSYGSDVEATEAFEGSGATYDFLADVFHRRSIDGRDAPLEATVHYGTHFGNAMWNGRRMVYGDGDGRVFNRFTRSVDVIGHELTHGVIQHTAALGYAGQTGAVNEHIADAVGMMVRQYTLGQSANESEWILGLELFGSAVQGRGVRSMAHPGTAYDDPILGRDPQPWHMRDYVHTRDDNGGVHINSGILNHGFYLAATAVGGRSWEVLGPIWYAALTGRLTPSAEFADLTRATVDIAGELHGNGSTVQRILADAWGHVGLPVPLYPFTHSNASNERRTTP